ncbi:MAG: hypothetical protein HAW61_02555 [Candidatus Portiera sp.]|nr:hypothetical protein [Portiera sp.]
MYIFKLESKYRFMPILILLLAMSIISPSTYASSIEQWSTETEIDDFTDEKRVFSYINSETGRKGSFIYVGCFPGKTFELRISTGRYIGDKELYLRNVRYRIDKDEAKATTMSPTNKRFVYSNDKSSNFLYGLMNGSSTVLVELTSYDYDTSKSRFSLKGSTKAVQAVLDACN